MNCRKTLLSRIVRASALIGAGMLVNQVHGAGFALNDHSATASGNALAGAAASKADISGSFWNPALLTNASGPELYMSGAALLPSMDVSANSASDPAGNHISGEATDVVDPSIVPAIYYAHPVAENTVAGLSFNVPFGLSGEYGRDWAGRYHSAETSVEVMTLAASVAHKVSETISVGGSLQVHKGSVLLAAALTDFAGGLSNHGEGYGELEGDDISVGYSLGVLFEPAEGTRIGLGHRSEIDFTFEGESSYDNVPPTLRALGVDEAYLFDQIDFPSVTSLGLEQDVNERLTVAATAMYTGWSSMDEMRIAFAPGPDNIKQPDSVITFKFQDQWFYSLGLSYLVDDKLTVRTGVARDYSPVRDEYRTARTPDDDRTWYSFGGSYQFSPDTELHMAYTYVDVDDTSVIRDGSLPEDASRGRLNADYETHAHVFSLGFNMKF
ncbi:OmpP1/FadL family transporter [Oceanospirillum sediminis]|uniref:Porin n=1 Tax=Oceanospirillum sediminis TaxID=2760088 RepID=A0A839IW22_9GAMM|nr:porin [Oceanospirillum sediminis]MBB1489171.1 porin [Oceanospirillum sediminis]